MKMSIEGRVVKKSKKAGFTRLIVNSNKPTEIYEPDFEMDCNNIKRYHTLRVVMALIMIYISLYYLEIR